MIQWIKRLLCSHYWKANYRLYLRTTKSHLYDSNYRYVYRWYAKYYYCVKCGAKKVEEISEGEYEY